MKGSSKKGISNNLLLQFNNTIIRHCDKEKLSFYADDISLGIKNFTLFQNFFNFKWPAWLYNIYNIKSPSFHHIAPFFLLNNNYRDQTLIPNSLQYVYTDLTGMISPINDYWSLEFWVLGKEMLYRPQEKITSVIQRRDLNSYFINTKWEEKNFKLSEDIYNIEYMDNDIKEIMIDLNLVQHKGSIPHKFLVVIRPYNMESIGNVESIEYNNKTKVVKINNYERIYLENKPEYVYAGNAAIGDITLPDINDKTYNAKCKFGMATLAFGYDVNRGDNEYKIRLNQIDKKTYKPIKINYQKYKNEYINNNRLRYQKGFKLTLPDNEFQNWVNGSRISALNHADYELSAIVNQDNPSLKSLFYVSSGYNRMGLLSESKKIIDIAETAINIKNKTDFISAVNTCYFINSFADYFKLSRDIDHLQAKYKFLREIANGLIQYSSGIKKNKTKQKKNSIDYYLIREYHLFDIIIIAFSLFEFSYLARCLGIFNDELKFSKESQRLEEIIINEFDFSSNISFDNNAADDEEEKSADDIRIQTHRNEYFAYNIFAGFPFNLKSLSFYKLKEITNKISDYFNESPVYFKSIGGCDILYSIIFAVNLLIVKNIRAHAIIEKLFESGRQRYVLPDYTNPNTGHGTMGQGDSGAAISAFFTLLRSVLFMDSQDRLEIFPVPKKEWFLNESEIRIENAPSIFGMVNFGCVSTRNEVQLHFYDVPKFIPPEIMINLPFPTGIKQEDDFIIKKEAGNSYLIHGWPGMVRFLKK